MGKVIRTVIGEKEEGYSFHCPACGYGHWYRTRSDDGKIVWQWNGALDKPTFTPSLLVNAAGRPEHPRCHLFVREGRIEYCGDCTHALAGKVVEMESVEG